MAKAKERILARELRRKGMSVRKIAKKVGVSKGAVSLWCLDIELTDEQKQKLIADDKRGGAKGRLVANRMKIEERVHRMRSFMNLGMNEVGKISERDLFMIGIALYWAEGNKRNRETKFVNSDPTMVKLWLEWLQKCAGVALENLIFRVGINQIHRSRIADVVEYWSNIICAPIDQFRSPSFKKVNNRKIYENFNEHYGSLNVIVRRGTNLNYKILGMIDAVSKTEANHDKMSRLAG